MILIIGCSKPDPGIEKPGPLLTPPLAPSSYGTNAHFSEVVTGDYDGQHYSMRVETEVTHEGLVVVGLSHVGVPLFTLEYKNGDVVVSSDSMASVPFDPLHVLSDLQLVHWPTDALDQALDARSLALEVNQQDGSRRIFDSRGLQLVEIQYEKGSPATGTTVVEHLDLPYRLSIEPIGQTETR